MKKIRLLIVIQIIVLSFSSFSQTNPITLPLTNDDVGNICHEVAYSSSKDIVFSYGLKKLIIYSASTGSVIETIDYSVYDEFEIDFSYIDLSPNQNYMIVDEGENILYLVTPKLSLLQINFNDLENINSTAVVQRSGSQLSRNIIRWDNENDKIYWTFSDDIRSTNEFYIYSVSSTNQLTKFNQTNIFPTPIFDVHFSQNNSPSLNYYYLSVPYGVNSFNAANNAPISTFSYSNESTQVKFFQNTLNTSSNRLFCIPMSSISPSNSKITSINTSFNTLSGETILGANAFCSSIFEANNDLVVFLDPINPADIKIYNISNLGQIPGTPNTITKDEYNNNCASALYSNNELFISKSNCIEKLSFVGGAYTISKYYEAKSNYFGNGIADNNNQLFFTNRIRSGINKFVSQSVHSFLQTGTAVFESVYYPDINKIVFFSKLNHENTTITMADVNNTTGQNNPITYEINKPIGDIIYNEFKNELLLITYNSGVTYLQAFNPNLDQFVNVNSTSIGSYCSDLYISPMQQLFISSNMITDQSISPNINILNANNYSDYLIVKNTNEPISQSITSRLYSEFTFDESYYSIYFTIYSSADFIPPESYSFTTGLFGCYYTDGTFQIHSTSLVTPKDLVWANMDYRFPGIGKCYFTSSSGKIHVWLCKEKSFEPAIELPNNDFIDIVVNNERSIVYGLGKGSDNGSSINKIYSIDDSRNTNEIASFGNEFVTGIQMNPNNFNILAYSLEDQNGFNGLYYLNPEIDNPIVNYTTLDNKNLGFMGGANRYEPFISFDTENDKMFVPNGFHSNYSVLDYSPIDRIELHDGVNWISVPKHLGNLGIQDDESYDTDEVFKQSTVTNGFETMSIEYNNIDPSDLSNGIITAIFDDQWTIKWVTSDPIMDNIYSSKGYKLTYTPQPQLSDYLYLSGENEAPDTDISIYGNNNNWVGYFLPEEQDIFDALGNTIEYLSEIWTQNYYCYKKDGQIIAGPTHGDVDYIWVCDKQYRPINYGDMVMLTGLESTTFQWQNSGLRPKETKRPGTEYFTYDLTANYTPIIISLDTTSNPLEIGAFIGTECIGAVGLLPEDTAVILKAYINEDEVSDITFQEYFGTKSSMNNVIDNYFTFNPENKIFEKRRVKSDIGNSKVLISFKNELNENKDYNSNLNFVTWPNPVNSGTINMSFNAQVEIEYDVRILSIDGRIIYTQSIIANEGYNRHSINLYKLNKTVSGVYIIQIKSKNFCSNHKILIN